MPADFVPAFGVSYTPAKLPRVQVYTNEEWTRLDIWVDGQLVQRNVYSSSVRMSSDLDLISTLTMALDGSRVIVQEIADD